jgi:hypothetical protein
MSARLTSLKKFFFLKRGKHIAGHHSVVMGRSAPASKMASRLVAATFCAGRFGRGHRTKLARTT